MGVSLSLSLVFYSEHPSLFFSDRQKKKRSASGGDHILLCFCSFSCSFPFFRFSPFCSLSPRLLLLVKIAVLLSSQTRLPFDGRPLEAHRKLPLMSYLFSPLVCLSSLLHHIEQFGWVTFRVWNWIKDVFQILTCIEKCLYFSTFLPGRLSRRTGCSVQEEWDF